MKMVNEEASDMYKWHEYFIEEERELSYFSGDGEYNTFRTATLGIPRLITRTHATKQICEKPIVTVDDTDYTDNFLDNSRLINTFFAYGTIFVFPFVNGLGELDIEIIKYDDKYKNLTYVEENNRLVLVEYNVSKLLKINDNVETKTVYYKHYLKDDAYYLVAYYKDQNRKIYLKDNSGEEYNESTVRAKGGKMLITKHELRLNSTEHGKPIYAEAIKLIRDADKTYNEMMNSMQLLRPVVGIPSKLVGSTVRDQAKKANSPIFMSEYSRLFAVIPGLEGELSNWQYFGGTYSPSSYIETLNVILDLVSKKTGLGARYLSYDMQQGGLRTAKEVIYSQNESFINQSLLNQSVELLIKDIARGFWKLSGNLDKLNEPKITIEMQDSVFNTTEDYFAALDQLQLNGDLNSLEYLQERFKMTKEDAQRLLGNSESQTPSVDKVVV